MQQSKEELYNIFTCWHDELTLDERRDDKKAWLVCLEEKDVVVGEKVNLMTNAQVIMDYLKGSDDYWAERLALKRPRKCLKWDQFYSKIYNLTKGDTTSSGKKAPRKVPFQTDEDTETQSPVKVLSPNFPSPMD